MSRTSMEQMRRDDGRGNWNSHESIVTESKKGGSEQIWKKRGRDWHLTPEINRPRNAIDFIIRFQRALLP
jgi:hypothetical protein